MYVAVKLELVVLARTGVVKPNWIAVYFSAIRIGFNHFNIVGLRLHRSLNHGLYCLQLFADAQTLKCKSACFDESKQAEIFGRNERIRTSDPFVPNEVRYQAAPITECGAHLTAQLRARQSLSIKMPFDR